MEKQTDHDEKIHSDRSAALLPPVLRQKTQEVYSRPSQHPGDVAAQIPPNPSEANQQSDEPTDQDFFSRFVLGQQERKRHPGLRHEYRVRQGFGFRPRIIQERPRDPVVSIWIKQGAPNTKRVQDSLDKETERTTQRSEFLQPPEDEKFPAVGYYLWDDTDSPLSDLLGESLQLLDDVRVEFKAFIDYEELTGYIRVRSYNRQSVEDAINGIKAKIQHLRADEAKLAPIFLVEPPSATVMKSNIVPKLSKNQDGKQQSIVEKVLLSGPSIAPEHFAKWEIKRNVIIEANQRRFKELIKKAFTSFRALKSGMRMRVHLGHLQLLIYRKDFGNSIYSLEKFSKMMGQNRTKVNFEKTLGDASFAAKVLEFFKGATEVFVPVDPQADSLAEVKPKHSLLILARVPSLQQSSQQLFRVESDIDMPEGERDIADQRSKDVGLKVGTTKYYKHDSCKTRFTLGSIGFESNFDWCLEMVTNGAVSPPPILQRLIIDSLSKAAVQKDSNFLDYPSIVLGGLADLQVDNAWIKSTLEYKLKGSPYIVEIAIYRVVETHLLKEGHVTKFEIQFYNKNWDLFMAPDDNVAHQRDWSEESFFPSREGEGEGLADFATKINAVQTCLDCISGTIS